MCGSRSSRGAWHALKRPMGGAGPRHAGALTQCRPLPAPAPSTSLPQPPAPQSKCLALLVLASEPLRPHLAHGPAGLAGLRAHMHTQRRTRCDIVLDRLAVQGIKAAGLRLRRSAACAARQSTRGICRSLPSRACAHACLCVRVCVCARVRMCVLVRVRHTLVRHVCHCLQDVG